MSLRPLIEQLRKVSEGWNMGMPQDPGFSAYEALSTDAARKAWDKLIPFLIRLADSDQFDQVIPSAEVRRTHRWSKSFLQSLAFMAEPSQGNDPLRLLIAEVLLDLEDIAFDRARGRIATYLKQNPDEQDEASFRKVMALISKLV